MEIPQVLFVGGSCDHAVPFKVQVVHDREAAGRSADFPVVQQRLVFTVQTVRFRVPLVQFVLLVDVAVFMQRHVGALVLRAVEVPQTQFIDRLVDMF